ncbi:MAG: tryptophan-rich sensory protein [Bacteroidetes bacterium]|nr:tryptophan-rich sensory protein [Bacteroidota bacterium]
MTAIQKLGAFLISLILPLAVGGLSGFFTVSAIPGWYQTIQKPTWNPPNWVFGPVWTTLYVLMGIAMYLVCRQPKTSERQKALWLNATQLVLNFFWSLIFFNLHAIGWALGEIVLLWGLIGWTMFAYDKVCKPAAWLLLPYIVWVTFATILNFTIWRLN